MLIRFRRSSRRAALVASVAILAATAAGIPLTTASADNGNWHSNGNWHAKGNWHRSDGWNGYGYYSPRPPVYYYSPPPPMYYYAPPPVYYAPAPIYSSPGITLGVTIPIQ